MKRKRPGVIYPPLVAWVVLVFLASCWKDREIFAGGMDARASNPVGPNVLFISMDDLNDWVEPLGGHPQARTPNLTRLAHQSVMFTRAYCTSPGCNPSRTAIMTGLAPHTSGVYSNYQDWREVITEYTSLGKYLRDHGYYSAGAGKIYHYHMVDPSCWDEYWPSQTKNMPDEYLPNAPKEEKEVDGQGESVSSTISMPPFENMYMMFDWAPLDIDDAEMGDYKSVEYVTRQLRKDREKPFFLACGIYRPHLPWYAPRKYFDIFPLESIQLPRVLDGDLDDLSDRAKDIAGRSLVPLLRNTEAEWDHPAISAYDFSEFSVRTERWRYTRLIDGSEELYDHSRDPDEWNNLANDPRLKEIKAQLARYIPRDPAPLKKTSQKLSLHHFPPFCSRAEYEDWLKHGKDTRYLIKTYWQQD